jgi:hypothetical protein
MRSYQLKGMLVRTGSPHSYSAGWALEGYAKATFHCVYRIDFICNYIRQMHPIQEFQTR